MPTAKMKAARVVQSTPDLCSAPDLGAARLPAAKQPEISASTRPWPKLKAAVSTFRKHTGK